MPRKPLHVSLNSYVALHNKNKLLSIQVQYRAIKNLKKKKKIKLSFKERAFELSIFYLLNFSNTQLRYANIIYIFYNLPMHNLEITVEDQ